MTSTIAHHDERINLRPVVLGVCFFWGITCGFLANVLRETPPAVEQNASANGRDKSNKKNSALTPQMQNIKQEQARQSVIPEAKPPEPAVVPEIVNPPNTHAEAATKGISAEYPPIPRLQLDPAYGLTGKTVRMPKLPLKVKEGPAPPTPATRNNYEDIEPPELD